MKYTYDLFISYESSPDDQNELSKKWIALFIQYAEILLSRLLKRTPNILLSDNLDDTTTKELLSQTAVFLTILSGNSLNSEHYMQELKMIGEVLNDKSRFRETRLIKIERSCIPHSEYPQAIKQGKIYNFCSLTPNEKLIFDLKELDIATPNAVYWMKLVEVAYFINESIQSCQNEGFQISEANNKPLVYLAETTPDQNFRRDLIKLELQHAGYLVVPEEPLPLDANLLKEIINEYLKTAHLSIHIIGNEYGAYLKDSIFSMVDFQNRHVAEYQKENVASPSLIQRIIWIPQDIRIVDERQAMYVEQIQRNTENAIGAEIITSPVEMMKHIMFEQLESFRLNPVSSLLSGLSDSQPNEQSSQSIFLISDDTNSTDYKTIRTHFEVAGYTILELIDKNGKKLDEYALYHRNLMSASSVFIQHSKQDLTWLQAILRDLIKVTYTRNHNSFKFKVLYSNQHLVNLQKSLFDGIFSLNSLNDLSTPAFKALTKH